MPNTQLAEGGVAAVELVFAVAFLVGVERAKGLEAGGGFACRAAHGDVGVDAKQLFARCDLAVSVEVADQPAVVAFEPARGRRVAVAVVVEEDGGRWVDGDGFDAVVVEVKCERISGRKSNGLPPVA